MNSILRIATPPIVATIFVSVVAAQDFKRGLTALKAGDYTTALKEWLPLAEQGDASVHTNSKLFIKLVPSCKFEKGTTIYATGSVFANDQVRREQLLIIISER